MTKFPPLDLNAYARNIFLAPAPTMKVCKCGEIKIPAFWGCCEDCERDKDRGPFEFERDQESTGEES